MTTTKLSQAIKVSIRMTDFPSFGSIALLLCVSVQNVLCCRLDVQAQGVPQTPESFSCHQRRRAAHRQRVKASSCLLPFDLAGVIKRRHVLTEVMGGPGGTSV